MDARAVFRIIGFAAAVAAAVAWPFSAAAKTVQVNTGTVTIAPGAWATVGFKAVKPPSGSGIFLTGLDPGQEVIIQWSFVAIDVEFSYYTTLVESVATKLEGAKLVPGANVAIFGGVQVRRLRLGTGDGVKSILYDAPGDGFAAYDPAAQPGVTTLSGGSVAATTGNPLRINGFFRSPGDLVVNGPVALEGGLLFVEGNLTVNGHVTGDGTIIATGNFTLCGAVRFKASALALGVGGAFSALP